MEGISSQSSVNIYKRALQDMYQDTDPDVKSCEEDAKTVNNSRQEKPPTSEIYS